MVVIIDSPEPEEILVGGARQFLTALTASCLLVSTVRAEDLTAAPKKSPETGTSASESADAFPDPSLDPTVLSSWLYQQNPVWIIAPSFIHISQSPMLHFEQILDKDAEAAP